MASQKQSAETTRVIFAELKGGALRKITVPESWIVTFGPIGFAARNQGGESPNVLRIYTDKAKKNLVGVYRDVLAMSDERVTITEKTIQKKQKIIQKRGSNGEQSYAAEIRKTSWRNPFADEPDADESDFDDSILALPASMTDA